MPFILLNTQPNFFLAAKLTNQRRRAAPVPVCIVDDPKRCHLYRSFRQVPPSACFMPLSEILQHVSKLDILKLLPPPDAENAGQNCPGDITTWNIDLLIEYALVGARIPSNYLVYMVNLSKQILVTEPNLVSITTDKPVYIIGDIHGSFHDMLQIFEQTGLPNQDSYFIFLGDIVDRGFYGVEALCLLTLFKIKYPSNVFIIRGNHESRGSTQVYGYVLR